MQSAIDHAFTNKPLNVHSYSKTEIDYSDHDLIYVKIKWKVPKLPNSVTKSRDFRKLNSNPNYFLNALTKIDWSSLGNMHEVDDMEIFWTREINQCLNFVAPMKTRKIKKKRFCLPKEIQNEIKKKKHFQRQLQSKMQNGETDVELERKLKKQKNFCNKMIKSFVREKAG